MHALRHARSAPPACRRSFARSQWQNPPLLLHAALAQIACLQAASFRQACIAWMHWLALLTPQKATGGLCLIDTVEQIHTQYRSARSCKRACKAQALQSSSGLADVDCTRVSITKQHLRRAGALADSFWVQSQHCAATRLQAKTPQTVLYTGNISP
jgi:hypothetical protein